MDMGDYFPNITVQQKVKLEFLIHDMIDDIEKYGGKTRMMDLDKVKKLIGYTEKI